MRDMTTNPDRLHATVKLGDRDIEVREPIGEQLFVLAQVRRMMGDDSQTAFRGIGLFGGVLDNLIVNAEDLDWAYNQLIKGDLALDDYLNLTRDIVEAFNIELPDEDEAPQRRPARAQAVTKRPRARR